MSRSIGEDVVMILALQSLGSRGVATETVLTQVDQLSILRYKAVGMYSNLLGYSTSHHRK